MSERTNISTTSRASLRTGTRFIETAPVTLIIVDGGKPQAVKLPNNHVVDCRQHHRTPKPSRALS